MTKIVNFPFEEVENNIEKPIEFKFLIGVKENDDFLTDLAPHNWENISLVSKGYQNDATNFDLICAWDEPDQKCFFWGHWNDGIV